MMFIWPNLDEISGKDADTPVKLALIFLIIILNALITLLLFFIAFLVYVLFPFGLIIAAPFVMAVIFYYEQVWNKQKE